MAKFIGIFDSRLNTTKSGPSLKGIAFLVSLALLVLALLLRFL
jgi:hypothetical protein